jgi:hypothetical protein
VSPLGVHHGLQQSQPHSRGRQNSHTYTHSRWPRKSEAVRRNKMPGVHQQLLTALESTRHMTVQIKTNLSDICCLALTY